TKLFIIGGEKVRKTHYDITMPTSMPSFMSLICLIMVININRISLSYTIPSTSTQLYVVPFPSLFGVNGDGSRAHPFSSLQQALDHIELKY
ncbi:unnamed protein product, partial [Adineta steineri]